MSEWLNSKESNTYPPYRFKLVNPETAQFVNLGVDSEPLEWASGIIELNRRIKVGGVFTSFAVSSLTFIKEGANFVRSIWTEKEFNGKCDLHVYWFKNSTRDYVEFPSSFALNFATCKPKKKIGKNAIGLNIEAINSDVLTKLDNRSDTDVDVTKTTTIGGVDIIDYGESGAGFTYQDLRKNINFPAYTIINSTQSRLPSSADGSTLPRLSGQISYCSVPVRTVLSDFDEIGDVVHVTRKTSLADVNSIFDTALVDYSFTFSYSVTVNVTDKHSVNPWTLKLIETDSLGAIVNENVFDSFGTIKQNYFYLEAVL